MCTSLRLSMLSAGIYTALKRLNVSKFMFVVCFFVLLRLLVKLILSSICVFDDKCL